MKSFAWLQKQNHKKYSETNQIHHQSKIKEVTKTNQFKKTAEEQTELMKIWREFL